MRQRRCLARAIGPEQAVDRAGRNREADSIDRARIAEILDEIDRFDRELTINSFVLSLSKHCYSYENSWRRCTGLRCAYGPKP